MLVQVIVKPGSRKGPLVEAAPDGLVVFLREKPHDGEANAALVQLLSKYYGVAKSRVFIVRGQKGHQKIVEITK